MTSKINRFIHLRNYTQYSLSKGALRINQLTEFCKKQNIPAAAITDFNNLFGSLEFCIECKKSGIQPIIGLNLSVRTKGFKDGNILLFCKNETGYRNLVNLTTKAYLDNTESNTPVTSLHQILNCKNGLICLAGGINGIITKNFEENFGLSDQLIEILKENFLDDFFLEIQRYKKLSFQDYENYLITRSLNKKIPIVATNENFYLDKNYFNTHDALLSIAQQKYIESEDRFRSNDEFYLKSVDEMNKLFYDIPYALENSVILARKCSFYLEERPPSLPKIKSKDIDENTLLKKESMTGLQKKIGKDHPIKNKYLNRLNFEIGVITKMGYSSYFLIVSDFIKWAKKNNIPVGPGRGSGAGSLVAWCLSITDLDPIKFGLIFERFLNPERISLPDFDVDFCMEKRDEVIKYVQKKYGELNVAQIITFGSFQARAALRDVGRVMQLPLSQVDNICKLIPYNPANPVSLKELVKDDKQIKKMIKSDKNLQILFEISSNLEGLFRHASTHAAGIVIAENPLDKQIPLYKDPKSEIPVTQFSMKYVEKIGLIKFDFLGLKTLTVIDETIKILKKKRSINIDIENIDLYDSRTYKMLKEGLTTGVFQLEGQGMRDTIIKIQPDRFEDLIAIVSLYRPGPMDNIPTYINRKQKKESYNYIHDDLKEILDETYGIMVYQEQVMLIAQKLAGFSLAKADLLRRAMGKKIKSEMAAQREAFINGTKKNMIDSDKASELFDEIAKFAGYGFNKSHAAAYAMIAYQTAFLKSNYPLEFLCALMNCDINNFDKLSVYCNEVKKLGFEIVRPDVNISETNFTVNYDSLNNPKSIKFGLAAIKNVGGASIEELVNERKNNGSFKSLIDLLKRVSNNVLNRKVLEALIFSNALRSIEDNQKSLCNSIDKIIIYNSNFHKNFHEKQSTLFPESNDSDEILIKSDKDWDLNMKLEKEIDAFGFYLSEHPTKIYKKILSNNEISDLDLLNFNNRENYSVSRKKFVVIINSINERITKMGKKFCFFNIGDDSCNLDVICFSEVLQNLDFELKVGDMYLFKISKQLMSDTLRLVVNDIKKTNKIENNCFEYNIFFDSSKLDLIKFENLIKNSISGRNKISFFLIHNNKKIKIRSLENFNVDLNFMDKINSIDGIIDVQQFN